MIEWVVGSMTGLGAAASARWTWWRPSVPGLSVLMYHKVGTPPAGSRLKSLWVSKAAFERQMAYLKREGFTTLSFSDVDAAAKSGAPLPERSVLVTFDDGYRNNYTEAFPVLQRHGVKGNIFLVYETLGAHNRWHNPQSEPWIPMLRWDDIRDMQASGLVDFGSHTMRHRNLSQATLEDARWELEESKKRLEDGLGKEVHSFAYPYGAAEADPRVRDLVLKAGYRFDYGIRQGKTRWPWKPEHGALPRLFIRYEDLGLDFSLKLARERARLIGDQL